MERYLIPFTIPLSGSRKGITEFEFVCDDAFFACFSESPVQAGEVNVAVTLDKRTEMYLLSFSFEGRLAMICDRCTADIRMPVEGDHDLILKNGEAYLEEDEVIVLPPETAEFNIAQVMYEYMILAIPVSRTYECEEEDPRPCNMETLEYLNRSIEEEIEEDETDGTESPFRNLLDELNNN